jgi:Outer membrane efflux protein.
MLSSGVMVNIPLFHGLENTNKYRKARAEASLYRTQLEDAKEKIELQVTRERKTYGEALEKLSMAQAHLASAEENLRTATTVSRQGSSPPARSSPPRPPGFPPTATAWMPAPNCRWPRLRSARPKE